MLVHASRSDVIGEEEVRHLLDLAPHAEYTRVEDASHMVVGDRNSRFNQAIVNFLTTHTTRDERA
jgi:pimeloyl-ACP methyl ester carboxylesterase